MKVPFGVDHARPPSVATASGAVVGLAGLTFVGVGLWARRSVTHALARERIVGTDDAKRTNGLVKSGAAARSFAEVIRRHTLEATGGRTYAEVDAYLDGDGIPTADAAAAARDPQTGQPVENPDHALWIQSTTLQTALMQAYVASGLADFTIALGGTLVVAGAGISAAGASRR